MTTLQANYGSIAIMESNTNQLVSKKAEDGTGCCICSAKFNEEEICIGHTAFNVDHVFHKECLKRWWDQGNRSCPVCRAHLTDSEDRLNRFTGSKRCCIGIALSVLCALGNVLAIAITFGCLSRI